ncbi:MAG: ABC transporter ATP-binding protein [Lachnospiraceae bacterium]|nr:ABC transporter ATP-binding protein [Lachnospiraceae bacterium]
MKPENAIEVKDIKKSFKVFLDKGNSLKEKVIFKKRNRYEIRQVLQGISFEVKKGEAIGLIGHNGCGKSTTLKLLTKIIYPDSGSIEMSGRVSSLIELGAGFHPDMSGRENIYTNAAIFGLTKKEIDARLDDIIRFSELEEYIDNPVRTYSSGMYMRLAFSVAINVDAEILLIDEILAVGDVNFQAKCFEKLKDIKRAGTTIVIVSHSLEQIEQICDRSYWIDEGLIKAEGNPISVHETYLSAMNKNMQERIEKEDAEIELEHEKNAEDRELPVFCSDIAERKGSLDVEFTDVKAVNAEGEKKRTFNTGDELSLEFSYKNHINAAQANIEFSIFRDDGICVYRNNYEFATGKLIELKDEGKVSITFPTFGFAKGVYLLNVAIYSPGGLDMFDEINNIFKINIFSEERATGVYLPECNWSNNGERV